MTQRELFTTIMTNIEAMETVAGDFTKDELLEGLKDRIFALDKKRVSSDKPSKKQLANEEIYKNLLELMADEATRTVRQITDIYNVTYNTEYSTNKIQPQITKAVKAGEVARSVVKGIVYFTKAEAVED